MEGGVVGMELSLGSVKMKLRKGGIIVGRWRETPRWM
jgi:hypothetical protein